MRDSALSLLRFRLQPFGFNPAIGAPKGKKKRGIGREVRLVRNKFSLASQKKKVNQKQ